MNKKHLEIARPLAVLCASLIVSIPVAAFGIAAAAHFFDGKWFKYPTMLAIFSVNLMLLARLVGFFDARAKKKFPIKGEGSK